MKSWLYPVIGVVVAIFGALCINYNVGDRIADHASWADEAGLPPPGASIYFLGLGLLAVGAGLVGYRLGQRKRG